MHTNVSCSSETYEYMFGIQYELGQQLKFVIFD